MPKKPSGQFFRATEPFAVPRKGELEPRVIKQDDVVSASDPLLRTHSHLFAPLTDESVAGVERTTAAPGESRSVGTQAGHEALAHAKGE